jgi:hypothetical protein
MTEVPTERPFATPDDAPILTTAGFPLVHVPPVTVFVRVVVEPVHKVEGPRIGGRAAVAKKDKNRAETIRLRCL